MVNADTKLTAFFNQPLDGWKLTHGYVCQRDHTLAGCFPVIDTEKPKGDDLVMCLDEDTWRRIWNMVEPRIAIFTKHTILLAPDGKHAYDVGDGPFDRKPILITTVADLNALDPEKKPFDWAPGLISFRRETHAQFPPFPTDDD